MWIGIRADDVRNNKQVVSRKIIDLKIFRLHIKAIYPPFNKKYKYFCFDIKYLLDSTEIFGKRRNDVWDVGQLVLSSYLKSSEISTKK